MSVLLPHICDLTNFILHEHAKCNQNLFSHIFSYVIIKSFRNELQKCYFLYHKWCYYCDVQLKKANIVPAYKKGDNQLINNYWSVSLLAFCAKVFQKIIFECLDTNKLLSNNQTGFASGDSCASITFNSILNQLESVDANLSLEVRGVFLDLSKSFNRVLHEVLMYKLIYLGVCGKYYRLTKSFLRF